MQSPLSALSRPILPLPPPRRLFSTRCLTANSSSCLDTVSRTQLRVSEIKAISSPVSVVEEEYGEEEEVEIEEEECSSEFVEVGYVCNVHGLKGELKVKPTTDFPEPRFCKPGRRWLRTRVMGEEVVREVELTGGRNHPGQKIWIISIAGIHTVDEAKHIVGSTILVKDDDRPSLEDDEFYTRDLLGMTVILKDGGTLVGTVVNVVNHGSSDLLHVMLDSAKEIHGKPGSSIEAYVSGSLVWIPFVKAIVPDVDMTKRVMQITPPKGLLDLNLRSDSRSKKERSHLEWRQKKKFQKRVIAAKKKLIEIGQKHVLDGFCFGEKDKKSMLANQIVNINFNLFQHAIKGINTPSDRIILSKFLNMDAIQKNSFQVSRNCLSATIRNDMDETKSVLQNNGLNILREHKVGIILVTSGTGSSGSQRQIHEFLLSDSRFMKVDGQRISTPLIIVSPENEVQFYQEQFLNHDYFGFDKEKVSFFEEEKLPVLNSLLDDQRTHRMLLQSPWVIMQSPVGSGGVFSLLSSQKVLDDFSKWGIEYVQICTFTEQIAIGHLTFLGLIGSRSMDVGIKLFDEFKEGDDEFDIIFSMKYLRKLVKQVDRPRFSTIDVQNEHVKLVEKEWIDVHPSMPNSICFQTSIYDLLDASLAADTTCILHITD